jgi:hypothetical protein
MAITLDGTSGITTPDITSTAGFDSADLTGDIAAARITNALNATGSAPIYACRAWVNFNGTGTVAIRASGNVSSITDNGTGDYTVNFTNAMTDANYCFNISANDNGTGTGGPAQTNGFAYGAWKRGTNSCVYNTGSMRFQIGYPAVTDLYDQTHINVTIFR